MSTRTKTGIASSTKSDKTVVVSVHAYKRHPKYLKRYRITKKFYAHDEHNACREGDIVTIQETRPLSKLKRWVVIDIKSENPLAPRKVTDVESSEESDVASSDLSSAETAEAPSFSSQEVPD